MYHLIYECHITCVFCIPFTYVLLGDKHLFIVIVTVIVIVISAFAVIFSCNHAVLWMVKSVRPPICLSVTPFWQSTCHHTIMRFSGVINIDKSDLHAKCQGQRSKVRVTEVKKQLSHFWDVTLVWINIWQWNDAQSLMWHTRGVLFFFKVIHHISRSHGTNNHNFDLNKVFPDCNSMFEFAAGYGIKQKAWSSIREVLYCF